MNDIATTIDELGRIKAEIASLKDYEAHLKTTLILAGVEKAEGDLFRVTISKTIRRTLDTRLIRKLVPKAVLHRAEKETESTVVRVSARKGTHVAKAA